MKEPSNKPFKSMTADERRQSGMEFVKEMEEAFPQPALIGTPVVVVRTGLGPLDYKVFPAHRGVPDYSPRYLKIERVIFNDPATIVYWADGAKTVVKCQPGDTFSKETGLALAFMKKALGNKGNFNNIFRKWVYNNEAN